MEVIIVCITLGYVFGCIIGFIGGRFVQKKDVEKFKSDNHKLCELKNIRIQKLENENKAAKEDIRKAELQKRETLAEKLEYLKQVENYAIFNDDTKIMFWTSCMKSEIIQELQNGNFVLTVNEIIEGKNKQIADLETQIEKMKWHKLDWDKAEECPDVDKLVRVRTRSGAEYICETYSYYPAEDEIGYGSVITQFAELNGDWVDDNEIEYWCEIEPFKEIKEND